MKIMDLLYMVNTIKTDHEFPLKEFVIEFTLPKIEYDMLLGGVNRVIYKNEEYEYTSRFEVTISDIKFRIISE